MEGVFMRVHVAAYALATLAVSGCASSTGNAPSQSGAMLPAGSAPTSQYAVTSLNPLGGSSAGANSINNQNWASGVSSLTSSPYIHAALWENGASAMDLGTLGGPNSGVEWPVKNERRLISGISETSAAQKLGEVWSCAESFFPQPPSGHICRGFAWRNNAMTQLPTLGGNNGFAAGANTAGEIVGWAETRKHDSTCTPPQVLQFEAVVYEPRGHERIRELHPLRGDKDGAATEINNRGDVVGISGTCDQAAGRFTAKHAVMWRDGRVVNLGSLGGVAWNTPMALNDKDEVVGFSDLPGDQSGTPTSHAFLWTKTTGMLDLGTLSGDVYSQALGINKSGQIVGVSYGANFATSRAFIIENGTMTDLNTLIPPSSGVYLLYANDINDQGIIAGGACVLVSGGCGTEFPAYMAMPTGSAAGRNAPARTPVILPTNVRRLIHQRAFPS
jgi:probable HAF family extracellular repeat protein